jgi:hypothetical protein
MTDTGEQDAVPGGAAAARPAGPGKHAAAVLRRAAALLADAGLVGGLLGLTWWVGIRSTDFAGSPKGGDALGHAATVQLLMENFPHVLWNPAWFGGLPSVPGLYPPLYALMIAAVVTASDTSIQHAMVACGAAAYLVMAASLYGFVRVIAKSRTAAGLAGLLVLTAPAFWEPSLQVGEYPRLTAMAFGYLATFIAALYTIKPSRVRFTAAVVATGVALANHPVTGGLGVLQVLGVLVFVPYKPRRDRLRTTAAAAAFMGGLAAWLYLPSLIGVRAYYILPQARFAPGTGTSFGYLLYPAGRSLTALSPILLPLALMLTGAAALIARRLRSGADRSFRRALGSSAAMMIVVLCVLGYAFAGRLTHAHVELVGVYPYDMFSYAAWPLAAASGVLTAGLLSLVPRPGRRWWRGPAFAVPYAGAIACLLAMIPILGKGAYSFEQAAYAVAPLLPGDRGTGQYRIGLTDSTESSWINVFTRTPEIGGPFNQGALNLDYIAWAESVLTDPAPMLAEAEFTAQWNSLRWIEAQPPQQGFYQRYPKVFRYVGQSAAYRNYEVRQPSPVLAATDTPPVLVVAPYDRYDLLLRSLAVTDDGPSRVIPVEGAPYIDEYSLAELEQFPVLFLYGFQAHNPARAARLIDAYVRAGGGLIADVAGSGQLAAELARDGAPLPVTSWTQVELYGRWGFGKTQSPMTRGIDLSKFSPALYGGTQPYLVEAGQKLAAGSEVALRSAQHPLVVTAAAGDGLVVESGINLPYHDAVFSNTAESSLLARMIEMATARSWASGQPADRAVVIAADSARLQVGKADGVLFKETDTPDWHATVNGHDTTVYPAGPGYMYIRLSSSIRAPATVEFRYQLSATERASIVLSVLTGLLLLAHLVRARLPRYFRARLEYAQQRLRCQLLPGTTATNALREVLQELLAGPSPQTRRQALTMLRGEPLLPYADLLLQAARTERDPACLSELRHLIVETQWEPLASPEIIELRRWAAGTSDEAALGTHVTDAELG